MLTRVRKIESGAVLGGKPKTFALKSHEHVRKSSPPKGANMDQIRLTALAHGGG